MKKLFNLLLFVICLNSCMAQTKMTYPVESYLTPNGDTVKLHLINHGSVAFEYKNYWIQIDPVMSYFNKTIDYSSFPKADIIFVTHEHGDHLNKESISNLKKPGTRVYLNSKSKEQLGYGNILTNGENLMITDKISAEAWPAYNTTEGRNEFHPKGNGNGYLFNFEGLNIYVSGDTEDIPELSKLKDKKIDVALLSVNQPYTMTPEQCVKAAKAIQPKILIPYHTGDTDTNKIKEGLNESGIIVKLFDSLK